jgi:hypothetical protein
VNAAGLRIPPTPALVFSAVLGVAFAVVLFGQGGQDDVYITYWPARALVEHGEIVNYSGLRLEQSSSLSLVLLLALLYALLPLSLPTLGFVVSLAGAGLATLVAVRLARRMGLDSRLGVLFVIASAPSFAYWATSGMETPWVALSALWLVDTLTLPARGGVSAAVRLAAGALFFAGVRPEAPLLLAGLSAVFLALPAFSVQGATSLPFRARVARVSACLAAIAVVFAFRKLYFDAWWPNPAAIKSGGFDVAGGAAYLVRVADDAGFVPLLLGAVGAGLVLVRRASEPAVLVTALAAGQLLFLVASGGDWMVGARFLAPIVPALALTGFAALEAVARSQRSRAALAAAYCAFNVGCALRLLHLGESEGQPLWTMRGVVERVERHIGPDLVAPIELWNKIHRRDAVTLSRLLPIVDAAVAHTPGRRVQVMTGQAGMLAYHLAARHYGRIDILDLWSLTDRRLLDCFPPGAIEASRWGSRIGTVRPFVEHDQLRARCGLALPDVFYNEGLEAHLPKLFRAFGYELIYRQVGDIVSGRGTLFEAAYPAFGFVAVKRELAEAAGLRRQPTWRWSLDPFF